MKVQSQEWSKIAEFYRSLDREPDWDILPMVGLVEDIAASDYVNGVYGITSMHTLCLSQHEEFEYGYNMLRVDFERERFIFRYMETPFSRKEWRKECSRDEGFGTFEHVMRRLRWFVLSKSGATEQPVAADRHEQAS